MRFVRLLRQLAAAPMIAAALAAAPAAAQVPLDGRPLDPLRYDAANRCSKRAQPGALALEDWMGRHLGAGYSWGIYNCRRVENTSQLSLHGEGRALDWHLDASVPAQRRAGERLIARLLAPDRQGRPFALARRMGLQEIIFNCRIWLADGVGLSRYKLCAPPPNGRPRPKPRPIDKTIRHRDHIHLGLNWAGARKRTTFWRYGYDRA